MRKKKMISPEDVLRRKHGLDKLSAEEERNVVEGRLGSKGFILRDGLFKRPSDGRVVTHQHNLARPLRMSDPIMILTPVGSVVAFFTSVGEYTDGW